MLRNTTEVIDSSCINILDDKTIQATTTSPNTIYTYKLIGDRYKLTETKDGTAITDYTCYTTAQISELPSPYDFIDPFLQVMAIGVAIGILLVAGRIILYPFYRSKY